MALAEHASHARRPCPDFVPLFLLRRGHIDARGLQVLLAWAWARLGSQAWPDMRAASLLAPEQAWKLNVRRRRDDHITPPAHPMNEATIMLLIVRLTRHARQVWPQAIVSIADLAFTGLGPATGCLDGRLHPRTSARLTHLCNRLLSLLALPCSPHPYLMLAHHQRAQFNLVQRMLEFSPPLLVNREGYRAVVKVQAAHKKTLRERQWAHSQAKSWPPWKAERLGIDRTRDGAADGTSRTLQATARMSEAGYAPDAWTRLAQVLGGRDTDGSPTIQTRSIIPASSARPDRQASDGGDGNDVWTARIRATRTAQEAWACFLNHEDRGHARSSDIYEAMLLKLAHEQKRRRRAHGGQPTMQPEDETALPGDGREVLPTPLSPHEAVFVRSEPPRLDELFDQMMRDGIRPSARCVALLLNSAPHLRVGLRFLRESRYLDQRSLAMLTAFDRSGGEPGGEMAAEDLNDLTRVPDLIFAAFLGLLCRSVSRPNEAIHPVLHAAWLLRHRRPLYRPCWNTVLASLMRDQYPVPHEDHAARSIRRWTLARELVQHMRSTGLELDDQAFQMLCYRLELDRDRVRRPGTRWSGVRLDVDRGSSVHHGCVWASSASFDALGGAARRWQRHGLARTAAAAAHRARAGTAARLRACAWVSRASQRSGTSGRLDGSLRARAGRHRGRATQWTKDVSAHAGGHAFLPRGWRCSAQGHRFARDRQARQARRRRPS